MDTDELMVTLGWAKSIKLNTHTPYNRNMIAYGFYLQSLLHCNVMTF